MRIIGITAALIVLFLPGRDLEAQDIQLKRLSLRPTGQIETIHLQVEDIELQIDVFGHIRQIALATTDPVRLEQRISGNHRLERVNDMLIQYRYIADGELHSIGDLRVVFDPLYPDLLESIGDMEFEYNFIGDKPSHIKRMGSLEFTYRFPDYRIEELGGARFHYSLLYNERLERIEGSIDYGREVEIYMNTGLPAYIRSEQDSSTSGK